MVSVNDRPDTVDLGRCYLYAYDTAIAVSDHHPHVIENKLNQSLDTLDTWFIKNKLSLNLKKCKFMIFGTSNQISNVGKLDIKYGGKKLERVASFKYSGMVLHSKLTFAEHVDHLKSKTYVKRGYSDVPIIY